MSYTKGPWRARTKETKHHIRTDIQAKIGNSWKTLFVGNYYANEEDNANLIAAAPDLVEALEDLVEEIRYRGLAKNIKKDFSLMNYLAQADKALTKAKGGQP